MTVLTVTPYERRYRQQVLDLLYSSFYVHTHLDWYTAEDWFDQFPGASVRLAWQERTLVGVMGASEEMSGTCWLRVVIVRDHAPMRAVLGALWESTRNVLKTSGIETVWLLVANDWLTSYAAELSFEQVESVITLARQGDGQPESRPVTVTIRPAEREDLSTMTRVDQTAFAAPWQLSHSDLAHAMRLSELTTTAWQGGEMIGYQLSTRHRDTGHLARLAVLPDKQNQGIGGALLHHLIDVFARRRLYVLTVNTQLTNTGSQRLYDYYGFRRNGYDLPVWKANLNDEDTTS